MSSRQNTRRNQTKDQQQGNHHQKTQPATSKTPPPDATAEWWCAQKQRFGHRTGWLHCVHSIGKFLLWLVVSLPLKLRPPACEAVLVGIYNNPTGACFFCAPKKHRLLCLARKCCRSCWTRGQSACNKYLPSRRGGD